MLSNSCSLQSHCRQVFEIQSQYARMAYEGYVAELSKLGEMYAGLTRNAYKPVEQAAAKGRST